jgi:acyl-CoA thioester hydrolase
MAGNVWFVAHFSIDYHAEMHWPGIVDIGTGIKAIGRSSVTFSQALFQDSICAATCECVMVQVDNNTRRPAPFTDAAKEWLGKFMR